MQKKKLIKRDGGRESREVAGILAHSSAGSGARVTGFRFPGQLLLVM